MKRNIPNIGYLLPLWNASFGYRSTAVAYLKREGVNTIENQNGEKYSLRELEEAMLGWKAPEKIGKIVGNRVELGECGEGFCYKDTVAFKYKSKDICYISEHGVEDGEIICSYTYQELFDLATEYVRENMLANTPQDIAETLFESLHYLDPSTVLEGWAMDLDLEDEN